MKQGELNVFLIAKYPVKVYFNAKVMMYEFERKNFINFIVSVTFSTNPKDSAS
jgi:hypothetical protein